MLSGPSPLTGRVTGMLLELPLDDTIRLVHHDQALKAAADEALATIRSENA